MIKKFFVILMMFICTTAFSQNSNNILKKDIFINIQKNDNLPSISLYRNNANKNITNIKTTHIKNGILFDQKIADNLSNNIIGFLFRFLL